MVALNQPPLPRFPLGQIVATRGALAALHVSSQTLHELLQQHAAGDWGDVCPDDRQANEQALVHGERLLSSYSTRRGSKNWVITEADRSARTLLLPDEY